MPPSDSDEGSEDNVEGSPGRESDEGVDAPGRVDRAHQLVDGPEGQAASLEDMGLGALHVGDSLNDAEGTIREVKESRIEAAASPDEECRPVHRRQQDLLARNSAAETPVR